MLRPLTLCLLLAAVATVSVANGAVLTENGMPIQWSQTAAQLGDLPAQDGVVVPNPWHYLHRMGLYRLLIAATDPHMGSMGTNATDSPFWGLPLQLGWELTSGRLADPTGASTCGAETGDRMCISTQSWWACVNYYFSVIPFLSAAQQGLFGESVQASLSKKPHLDLTTSDVARQVITVKMQVPEGVTDYCTTYADCASRFPDLMTTWDAFYQGLKTASASDASDLEKKDRILGLYWAAHQASMAASASCSARQAHYPGPEVTFADTWQKSADYIAAVYFQSNMENSVLFMRPLPGRVLKEGDQPPNIPDMTLEENNTLRIFSWMRKMNTILGGTLVRMWRGAMCSIATRKQGRALLENLLLNPNASTSALLPLISAIAAGC